MHTILGYVPVIFKVKDLSNYLVQIKSNLLIFLRAKYELLSYTFYLQKCSVLE